MSTVSDRERALILDLLLRRVSEEEFYRAFPIEHGAAVNTAVTLLEEATRERDAQGVELAMYMVHYFGAGESGLPLLNTLLGEDWHRSHESIVDVLAKFKHPSSVEALYRAAVAQYPYRGYDDAFALESKTVRLLGKIGDRKATKHLGSLVDANNQIVSVQARKQLSRLAGTAESAEVRHLAQQLVGGEESH